jgi:hypothetical protein
VDVWHHLSAADEAAAAGGEVPDEGDKQRHPIPACEAAHVTTLPWPTAPRCCCEYVAPVMRCMTLLNKRLSCRLQVIVECNSSNWYLPLVYGRCF